MALLVLAALAGAHELQSGPWRAWLESPGGELPFELELRTDPEPGASIANGAERIEVPRVAWDGERLVLDFPHYAARIEAAWQPEGLHGQWTKRGPGGRQAQLAFEARPGRAPRFSALADPSKPPTGPLDGRWRVDFESDDEDAVALFELRPPNQLRGTFLTVLGDYRYLDGTCAGDELLLSCFDGAHAFLFRAHRGPDGALAGDFWSGDSWHERWSAVRDDEARLPDPFALAHWNEDRLATDLRFRSLNGEPRSLGEAGLAGRPGLVQLFGTWCPNCHDETRMLLELERHYGERLAIIGVAFEHTGRREQDALQVRRFRQRYAVPWPILLGGRSDKDAATEAIGALDHLKAYPTTLFVSAAGHVRWVHTGFAGPATGRAHQRLRAAFEARIEELLDEDARGR